MNGIISDVETHFLFPISDFLLGFIQKKNAALQKHSVVTLINFNFSTGILK